LGWFNDVTQDGRYKTVEDFMRAKGEKQGQVNLKDGVVEYQPDDPEVA
jgi:hypothetical protein